MMLLGTASRYLVEYPTKAEQQKFLKELSWRLTKGGSRRTVYVRVDGGTTVLTFNGVELRKAAEFGARTGVVRLN
jgi:hypothetical protein